MHLQNLTIGLRLETLTLFSAAVTRRLHLLYHRPHSDNLGLSHLERLIANTVKHSSVCHLPRGHLLRLSIVELFERDLEWLHEFLAPGSFMRFSVLRGNDNGVDFTCLLLT